MNDGTFTALALISLAAFGLYAGQVLRAKREYLAYKLRRALCATGAYLAVAWLAVQIGRSIVEAVLAGVVVAFGVALCYPRMKYSRRIPADIRRRVIERDLKGEPFDPNRHQIDHIVPFSRGGGHTMDNLRVVERSRNLQKGARMPTFGESASSVARSVFRR